MLPLAVPFPRLVTCRLSEHRDAYLRTAATPAEFSCAFWAVTAPLQAVGRRCHRPSKFHTPSGCETCLFFFLQSCILPAPQRSPLQWLATRMPEMLRDATVANGAQDRRAGAPSQPHFELAALFARPSQASSRRANAAAAAAAARLPASRQPRVAPWCRERLRWWHDDGARSLPRSLPGRCRRKAGRGRYDTGDPAASCSGR